MDIRRKINERPAIAAVTAIVLCMLCVGIVLWRLFGSRSNPQAAFAGKTFFSDDDGKTWFIDDESKIPPFDHNGKQAYRAAVFRCGAGKPFVAYLEKYSASELSQLVTMQKAVAERSPGSPIPTVLPNTYPLDVKKPGDSQWVSADGEHGKFDAAAYQNATRAVCPDGSLATPMLPYDPDAQQH